MGKNREVSYTVVIKNDPDKAALHLIDLYWKFKEGEFTNKPTQLSKENNLTLHELFLIIKENSIVNLERNCGNCNKLNEVAVTSQSHFMGTLRNSPLCEECNTKQRLKWEETERKVIEIRRKNHELAQQKIERQGKFNWALNRYKETRFTDEQAKFMIHFMDTCPEKISLSFYSENYVVFYKFQLLDLIKIEENLAEKFVAIYYPVKLREILENHINRAHSESENQTYKSWSRLSFHLEKNKSYRNSNTPRFSGTIIFKEDIVIKKGTKCLYGVWDRDNDDAWLTLTPTSDIIVAKNKPIHKEPEHIANILNRFLDNPENRDY